MDYRAALIEFYQKHNPDKLREIDLLLSKYKGREEELLHALRVKYGVHKTEAQAQAQVMQQAPTQPQRENPVTEQEAAPPGENSQNHESRLTGSPEGGLNTSAYKGRTAAERADYWRKELEKREREKGIAENYRDEKRYARKNSTNKSIREEEFQEVEPVESRPIVKTAIIASFLTLLLVGLIYVFLNKDMRASIGNALGLGSSEQPKVEKKEGIDPNVLAQNQDSNAVKPSGDFALEGEEDSDGGNRAPRVEDIIESDNPQKQERKVSEKTETEEPEDVSNPGIIQRGKWYLSYTSVSNENFARKTAGELKSSGYSNAGYYYIPDYNPKGKSLYKVYLGPYPTVESAEGAIDDELRNLSPGTYAYLLE